MLTTNAGAPLGRICDSDDLSFKSKKEINIARKESTNKTKFLFFARRKMNPNIPTHCFAFVSIVPCRSSLVNNLSYPGRLYVTISFQSYPKLAHSTYISKFTNAYSSNCTKLCSVPVQTIKSKANWSMVDAQAGLKLLSVFGTVGAVLIAAIALAPKTKSAGMGDSLYLQHLMEFKDLSKGEEIREYSQEELHALADEINTKPKK